MSRSALPDSIYAQITALTDEGNALADRTEYREAWKRFHSALQLVPDPKEDWETTTWILASMGDMAFLRQSYEAALDALEDAKKCPGGIGNVFIHLRLGQVYFELGNEARAANELTLAYMGGGREVFSKEDPKYFALLERLLKPPLGHDRL